ncbi:MAG TPA: hypothetical protein VIL61_05630 [Nitrospiria bacterium]
MRNFTKISSAALLIVFGLAVSPGYGEMMEKEKGMMGKEGMMGEHKMALMADSAGKGAKGEAVIKDSGADRKEIVLHLTGLKSNSVYTVWLVNMKPKMDMIGIGEGDYAFKTDDQGNGHYSATVSADELQKWQMLEIAYHPDGDPKNMKKMGIALKTGLMMEKGGMMMDEKKGMMEKEKGMMNK